MSQVSAQQVHPLPRGAAVRDWQRPLQQQQLPVHPPIDPHQPVGVQSPHQTPQLLRVGERISECISYLIWYVAVFRLKLLIFAFRVILILILAVFVAAGAFLRHGGGLHVSDPRRSPVVLRWQTGAP